MDSLTFLPPELPHWWQAILIIVASFIGSAMTAAFSIGGGLLLIAVISTLLPAPAVVPVHGAMMVGSNAGRTGLLLKHVDWSIWLWFAAGAAIGGLIGAQIAVGLPGWLLRVAIASFILFTQWGPKLKNFVMGPKGYALAGAISTVLTLFVGASGPFMTTVIAKAQHLQRQGLIATTGACMTLQHTVKVIIFALAGFAFAPWLPLIGAALISGFAGTVLGTRLLGNMPEALFRKILKWLLTIMALWLLVLAATGFSFTG